MCQSGVVQPIRPHVLRLVAGTVVFAAGVVVGVLLSADNPPIEPARIEQYYGVSSGVDTDGRYCIENDERGERCADLRLPEGSEIPDAGLPVRGGAAALPDDSSDLPTPVWLWVTPMSCDSTDTDQDLAC